MGSIFDNAEFGDRFMTRSGMPAVYWNYDKDEPYGRPHRLAFKDGGYANYGDDGVYHKGNPHASGLDIIMIGERSDT